MEEIKKEIAEMTGLSDLAIDLLFICHKILTEKSEIQKSAQ